MNTRYFARVGVLLALLALAGCGRAPEDRISGAAPVPPAVQAAQAKLVATAKARGADVSALEAEIGARLKTRALKCVSTSAADVAAAVAQQKPCFDAQDAELLAWINGRRLAFLVSAPPLRPLPKVLPRLVAPTFVSSVGFAEQAGVAIASDVGEKAALLDINDGSIIWQGDTRSVGKLSPNGRVFAEWVPNVGTHLRDSETGEVLMELRDQEPYRLNWIGDRGLVHVVPDAVNPTRKRTVFRDLETGLVSPLDVFGDEVEGVVPAAGSPDRYWLLHFTGVSEMLLTHSGAGWAAKLVSERKMEGTHSSNAAGISADGRFYYRSQQEKVFILDTTTGQVREESFPSFYVQGVNPTEDPDGVLVVGFYRAAPGSGQRVFVYSLSRHTLVPAKVANRFFFVPSLRVTANIDDRAIYPAPIEITGVPADIATTLGAAPAPRMASEAMRAPPARVEPAPAEPPTVPTARIAELAAKSKIVGVGSYGGGIIQVRVLRTRRPIVLVLNSRNAVNWVVTAEPGAEISAILLSGPNGGQVMGSQAPVERIGSAWASASDGDMRALGADVLRWTGKSIETFHDNPDRGQFFLHE